MWQDAHRRGGRDEIGWGRGEDVGEAVSEGRREALGCSVLRPGGLEATGEAEEPQFWGPQTR